MVNWDLYNKRLNVGGTNKRERMLHRTKDMYNRKSPDSPSYKNVKVNGLDGYLVIDSTSPFANNPHKKSFTTVGDTKVVVGDYIEWINSHWLVIEADIDDELYIDGKIQQCNYTLKFQSPTGTILSYPCYTSGNKFSQDENKTITLNSNQKSILLPKDENTLMLKTDRRLFVDTRNQSPYKIIGDIDTTTYNYGDKGLIEILVEQDELLLGKDRQDLGICNYFEPDDEPEHPNPSEGYADIVCSNPSNEVTVGGLPRTLTPTFYNSDGTINENIVAVWEFDWNGMDESNFKITYDGNKVSISVISNYDLIGNSFTVHVKEGNGWFRGQITLLIMV